MNSLRKIGFLFLAFTFLIACGCEDEEGKIVKQEAPALLTSSPENGATNVATGSLTLVLTFDQNITSPTAMQSQVSLGDATINKIIANLKELKIQAEGLEAGKVYTLIIPQGVVVGPTKVEAGEIRISFETRAPVASTITTTLVTENPLPQAQNVYDFLLENYGTKAISSTHANVNWNTNEAEWVKLHAGKYPAMNTFDYVHLRSSASGAWIDYSDLSVIQNWWNNNGIIVANWHWLVPPTEAETDPLKFVYNTNTDFKAENVLIDGTRENIFAKADLDKLADYIKLLQDNNIPMIWRPLHEAAGNTYEYAGGTAWFWWGADGAETYKALWRFMFDYFKEKGLNNLIWVWTTQTGDNAFYPGDEYVDIIGRDIYNNSNASDIAAQFEEIQQQYPNKMVALSEFGNTANLSDQWNRGAKWSYFMPWYDYDRTIDMNSSEFQETAHGHANIAWWTDALNQDYVITRDEMPSLK